MTNDEIRESLSELVASQREMGVELRELKADVAQIKHVLLEGNGTPAMTVRVALVEHELERVREERTDAKLPRAVWVGLVLSAVLGIGGILAQIV